MASYLDLVRTCATSVLGGKMPPPDVVKLFVSKSLGFGILGGACVTKIPQISAILKSGSAAGLSPLAFELETLGLLIHTAYGYLAGLPFNAYGEAGILCAQSLIILTLIYRYSGASSMRVAAVLGVIIAFISSIVTGRVGLDLIRVAFDANNLIMMSARLPQIYSNWRSKSTGQLSLTTCTINVVGCVARIFTSIAEKTGTAMIRTYIISLVLNSTLVLQILMYAKKKPGAARKARTPAKKKAA